MKEGGQHMGAEGGKVKTFKDLVRRQESITKFVVAVERNVEENKENQDRSPQTNTLSTPVSSRIKRFEKMKIVLGFEGRHGASRSQNQGLRSKISESSS